MPLSTYTIITATISTTKLPTTPSSSPLPPLPTTHNMHTNYLHQPLQGWPSDTTMDAHRLHHQYQVEQEAEREHMFEKPLTPSDVGKLNRLVIPKQHAEKYFPLAGESGGEKGLLLSFEDEDGKPWRFRYSYWTSSQSYVLTKGWSRFVKEKRLDAGDVVLFQHYRSGEHVLYIGCRRRGETQPAVPSSRAAAAAAASPANAVLPWSQAFGNTTTSSSSNHCHHHEGVGESAAAAAASTRTLSSKRVRLFGVNLD